MICRMYDNNADYHSFMMTVNITFFMLPFRKDTDS